MVDRDRVLAKLDELEGYLGELRAVMPVDLEHYQRTPAKRACERLLQLCIECAIDIGKKMVIGNRLGIPNDEADVFEKLKQAGILSADMLLMLKKMRGMRNILVHEYADVDDGRVMDALLHCENDLKRFKTEILAHLSRP